MEKLKNYLINQYILSMKKSLKIKIFDYFHSMLDGKTSTSFVTLYFLHFIEIFQLISLLFRLLSLKYGNYQKKLIQILEMF